MGIDHGIFCDDCREFVNAGELIYTRAEFQRFRYMNDFLMKHIGHKIIFLQDCMDEWLEREYDLNYKQCWSEEE